MPSVRPEIGRQEKFHSTPLLVALPELPLMPTGPAGVCTMLRIWMSFQSM